MGEKEADKVEPEACPPPPPPPVQEKAKVEPEACSETPPPPPKEPVKSVKDVSEEKTVVPVPVPADEDCKALVAVEKPSEDKKPEGSIDRDAVLARVATEKRLSLIKAWEESEKSKAENKAQKNLSSIGVWENCKKANLEAELKKIEEDLEKKKAAYVEKIRNKVVLIHKAAEEKRAYAEARRGEELLKAEESAAKYRATGTSPKKLLGCF